MWVHTLTLPYGRSILIYGLMALDGINKNNRSPELDIRLKFILLKIVCRFSAFFERVVLYFDNICDIVAVARLEGFRALKFTIWSILDPSNSPDWSILGL